MSDKFKLFRLQQVDSQLDRVRERLREIAVQLADRRAVELAEREEQSAHRALESARKSLRRAEAEVETQELKIKSTEQKLYGGTIKNPKELADLHNEATALKRYLSVLEDRQLEAMLALDEAQKAHQRAKNHLDHCLREHATRCVSLEAERDKLEKEVARLEEERSNLAVTISAENLRLYETLRKERHGISVARVSGDNTCSACGATLTSKLLQSARSSQAISQCASCKRILYAT
jgi:hypothetical protein